VGLFFISYKHEDKEFADILWRWVCTQPGFTGWIDFDLIAGDDWEEIIDNQLEEAIAVIVIVSTRMLPSQYIAYEWAYAFGNHKKVVPVLLESVDRTLLHKKFEGTQYVDFTAANPKDPEDPVWEILLRALREINDKHDIPSSVTIAKNTILTSHTQVEWESAIGELFDDRSEHATNALADLLGRISNPRKRVSVALAFAKKTDYLDAKCIEALHDGIISEFSIGEAFEALGRIGTDEAIAKLIDAGGHFEANSSWHQALLIAIGYSASKIASEYLLNEILAKGFVQMALDSLDRNCHPDIAPALLEILLKPETSLRMKTGLATVIGKFGNASFVPELIKLTDQYSHYANFLDLESMGAILRAIGKLNTEEGNSKLHWYLSNSIYHQFYGIITDSLVANKFITRLP